MTDTLHSAGNNSWLSNIVQTKLFNRFYSMVEQQQNDICCENLLKLAYDAIKISHNVVLVSFLASQCLQF